LLHRVIASAALDLKKHVFCEKPLATSEPAARQLVTSAAHAGVANVVDFEFPEIPEWCRARALLASGILGRVRHVRISWYVETYANRVGLKNWKTSIREGGGALNDFASHCFYYLEWLLGPIRTVWAAPSSSVEAGPDADPLAVLCVMLQDDTVVSVSLGTAAVHGNGHSVTVHGDDGTIALVNRTADYAAGFQLFLGTRETPSLQLVHVGDSEIHDGDGRIAVVGRLVGRFLDWALTGARSRPSFEDGLRVQVLLDAAWRSRTEGTWCQVPSMAHGTADG
jgi:predicted dehydrogenase